ncbi:dnaJ homolog subfamily B member 7 isoform X1 [Amborella trichopoda]|uniref:dnaJ homolog subfamily B member 7 isoform X1 n=1 Tax=Amborella trichopoda TaxID=13333 RepID=UPI0005D328C0|nr:dnaJ homolog subfamily B member 7 isoform X1 [Amborella trichopoda]|eukprot:XP_011623113.1 dnaJ homolog subfamily B member 7 isoform X1 [Amborella trichopoda]
MAPRGEKDSDFYAILGLKKECSASDLRNAYKRLALSIWIAQRWHPDRCSASGNTKFVEECKKKFQAIQQAYSVLSDANKRFLYDVGAYGSDDDDQGMGEFLGEMAVMMSQTKPSEKGPESFEDLQNLFQEMFERDLDMFKSSTSHNNNNDNNNNNHRSSDNNNCSSVHCFSNTNKRNCSDMNAGEASEVGRFAFSCYATEFLHKQTFSVGADDVRSESSNKRRNGRKQKSTSSSRKS